MQTITTRAAALRARSILTYLRNAACAVCCSLVLAAGLVAVLAAGLLTGLASASPAHAQNGQKPLYQYGTGVLAYWSSEDHLINAFKQNDYEGVYADMGNGQRMNFKDLVEAGHFDPATQTFKSLPFGKKIFLGFVRGAARRHPAQYAGKWIVDWEGDGDVALAFARPTMSKKAGSNRLEVEFGPDQNKWSGVFLTWVGDGGVRNIRIYRASDEAALKQGRLYSKDFVALVKTYPIVRTMDLALVNSSGVRTLNQIADVDTIFWGGQTTKYYGPAVKRGFPISAQVRLAIEADNRLWLTVPPLLGLPAQFDEEPYFSEVTVKNSSGKNVDIFADRVAGVARQTVDAPDMGAFARALVDALIKEGYPSSRMLYVEVGNEIWNNAGAFRKSTHFHNGLAQGLGLPEGRDAYGYRSAQFAEAFEKALAAAGRDQVWTQVVGAHTANPYRTEIALRGVESYYAEKGLNPRPNKMKRFGVATTNYYSGGFSYTGGQNMFNAPNADEWRRQWLAERSANPERLAQRIEDWLTDGPATAKATRAWIVRQHKEHAARAARVGATYIGNYEGGSHDVLDHQLRKDAGAVALYRTFMGSERAARVLKAVNDSLIEAFPGAILADYRRIGHREGAHVPWDEQIYGEPTPVTRTLDSYLGAGYQAPPNDSAHNAAAPAAAEPTNQAAPSPAEEADEEEEAAPRRRGWGWWRR